MSIYFFCPAPFLSPDGQFPFIKSACGCPVVIATHPEREWAVVWGRMARWSTGKTYDGINRKKQRQDKTKKRNLGTGSKNDQFNKPRKKLGTGSKNIFIGGVLDTVAA